MTYYKIVKNKKVIDIGCTFLKWKKNRLYVCSEDEGQFIQSLNEKKVYRDVWMKEASDEFTDYEQAKIKAITETEFEDLRATIDDGEEIVEQEEVVIPSVQEEVQPEEDKPLSISDMRKIILEQQRQIEMLMEKLNDGNAL